MSSKSTPFRFGFLLLPRFSPLTLSGLVEPLRIANYCAGQTLYSWEFLSEDGKPVTGSTDIPVSTRTVTDDETASCQAIIVCGGWNTERYDNPTVFQALKRAARNGLVLGAAETGTYVLAQAGLLEGYDSTIHWHCHNAFSERFPHLKLLDHLYVIDRKRMTCAGGTACLDMMLGDIESRYGTELAQEVASQVLLASWREGDTPQRQLPKTGTVQLPQALRVAIDLMEENIEEPLSIPELARRGGISQRKLERLFSKHRGRSAVAYYRLIRLQRARVLLTHTDMSVMDICIACGFSSSSYFSKSYTEQFSVRPRDHRTAWPESEPNPRWPAVGSHKASQ